MLEGRDVLDLGRRGVLVGGLGRRGGFWVGCGWEGCMGLGIRRAVTGLGRSCEGWSEAWGEGWIRVWVGEKGRGMCGLVRREKGGEGVPFLASYCLRVGAVCVIDVAWPFLSAFLSFSLVARGSVGLKTRQWS